MQFKANNVECWSDKGLETVFFGNSESEWALTISNFPGTADHYLEWNDQSNACTNAVQKAHLAGFTLHLQLKPEAAKQLGTDAFTIGFDCSDAVYEQVTRGLTAIFGAILEVKPGDRPSRAAPEKDYSGIKYLNLEGKNLRELPDYVQEMTALETVKLARNPGLDFQSVCAVLAKLPAVKSLTFSTDQPIPENLGALRQLESLSLDGLLTPKTLPESIGQLRQLKYLFIMSASEVFLPESFADLTQLEELYMRVEGWQLPSAFYRLSHLKQLDLSNCNMERAPESMAGMEALESVILGSPEIQPVGEICAALAGMPKIRSIELYAAPLPKEIGLLQQIEELIISTGFDVPAPLQMPDELFELRRLKILLLNMNLLAEIPAAIGNLSSLQELVFLESDFETLPESIGNLPSLTYLNISENPSLCSLPESLGKLTQLKRLYLCDNPQLKRLPDSLKNLKNLEDINITGLETMENVPENWDKPHVG